MSDLEERLAKRFAMSMYISSEDLHREKAKHFRELAFDQAEEIDRLVAIIDKAWDLVNKSDFVNQAEVLEILEESSGE